MKKHFFIIISFSFLLSCTTDVEKDKSTSKEFLDRVIQKKSSVLSSLEINNELLSLQLINDNINIEDSNVIQHFVNVDSRYEESIKICTEVNEFMLAISDGESIDEKGHQYLDNIISDYINRVNRLIQNDKNKINMAVSKVNFDETNDALYISSCLSLKIDICIITQRLMLDYLSCYNKNEWEEVIEVPTSTNI